MQLDDTVMRCMQLGRVCKESTARINSLDFHRTEQLLVAAGDDDAVNLYDAASGRHRVTLMSKKYGAAHVVFTHAPSAVIYASNKEFPGALSQQDNHALRYCSLHDNKYIRYFPGHTERVVSLALCARSDLLLSAAQDRTVRLWDVRASGCQAIMHTPGQPCATFDQQGLVFAVSADSGVLKLYDVNQYDKGPFDTFVVEELRNSPLAFSYVRFSADGKLLLAVAEGRVYVLDAFDGKLLARFLTGTPEGGTPPEAAFSYDGQYVLSGCEDRAVRAWSVATRQEVARYEQHPGVPLCVKWAPRHVMFASACQALCLWIPNMQQVLLQQQHAGQAQTAQQMF